MFKKFFLGNTLRRRCYSKMKAKIAKLTAGLLALTGVLFVVYIDNIDGKIMEYVYDKLWVYHNNKEVVDKI